MLHDVRGVGFCHVHATRGQHLLDLPQPLQLFLQVFLSDLSFLLGLERDLIKKLLIHLLFIL